MALMKEKVGDLPTDAVVLSEDKALEYELKIIRGWKKPADVWALHYGPGILGALSAVSGVFINHYYRKKLNLGRYGHISTYLPIVVLPAVTTVIFHQNLIQRSLILNPHVCPVCLEIRSSAIQVGLGIAYPAIIAPIAAFMFAARHYTYRVPLLLEEPMAVLKLWRKLSKSITTPLAFGFTAHTVIAMIITLKEIDNVYTIQNKLLELEKRLENSV